MFKSATFKLTLSYLGVLLIISLLFSSVVYRVGSDNLSFVLGRESRELSTAFPIFSGTRFGQPDIVSLDAGKTHLLDELILTNLIVLVGGGIISYVLARETLKPIEETHEQQVRFVADVSHELRTPLTALRMESEVALMDKKLEASELRRVINSNIEEATKLESLINNLMKLSLLEAKDLQAQFKIVSLNKLTNEAVMLVKAQADAKKITLKINKPGTSELKIKGDSDNIVQMIVIFLDNAIKYSPNKTRINLNLANANGLNSISIIDQGSGISEDNLDHIFDRFYRGDASRSGDGGFGLGLSIAKLIADIHKANIIITSAPNKGTTVRVDWPAI